MPPATPAMLPDLPLIDARIGGLAGHARRHAPAALALREECLRFFPAPARTMVPLLDRATGAWLRRSASPYAAEIAEIAAILGISGVWFLNGSYQWGCTTRAAVEDGTPWLVRTLDWPFAGLGRHAELLHLDGPAGDYYGVTWPAYVGILTGMAPGRFALAINQAPMRRRTARPWLRPADLAANALGTWGLRHMPPDHLARQVLEICPDFAAARARLETVPLARPAIFTLIGCRPDETCIIERSVTGFATRSHDTVTANDWAERRPGWEGRIASHLFLNASPADAAENNRARRAALAGWDGRFAEAGFSWVTAPVLNLCTRLAVEMCPARGILRVAGYEIPAPGELPQPVTRPAEIGLAPAA